MAIIQHISVAKLDYNMRANFWFENFHVYTLTNKEYIKQWRKGVKDIGSKGTDKYLVLEAWSEIEKFDSLNEGVLNLRPELLVVLGILTFVTGELFTVYGFHSSRSYVIQTIPEVKGKNKLIFDGEDKDLAINQVLGFLAGSTRIKKELVFSMLDRYRKAHFMVRESEDNYLYNDESFLAFFHIFELLATQFSDGLKLSVKSSIRDFVSDLLTEVYLFDETKIANERIAKQKLIEQIFAEIPVSVKICTMFKHLNIFDGKSRQIIEDYVKLRNDIAHGRSVFNKQMLWPLPPFFPQVKDIADETGTISLLAARTIDAYLGSDLYKGSWETHVLHYPPILDDVKEFIRIKSFTGLSVGQFRNGKKKGIAPWVLTYYLLHKKLSIRHYEEALTVFMLAIPITKKNMLEFLDVSILLSDSKNEELNQKCRSIIVNAFSKRLPELRARDYYKEFKYCDVDLEWFKYYITEIR